MNQITRRQLMVGGTGLGVAGFTLAVEPRRESLKLGGGRLATLIPLRIGGRVGVPDLSLVPDSVDLAATGSETLARSYPDGSASPFLLLVGYHTAASRELKVHRPETCYEVAGFVVTARRSSGLTWADAIDIPSVSFEARRPDRTETVLYWTRVADSFPQTLTSQRLAFLGQAVRGVRADGLLVRLSTGGDARSALSRLQLFGAELIRDSTDQGRRLLLGPAYRSGKAQS